MMFDPSGVGIIIFCLCYSNFTPFYQRLSIKIEMPADLCIRTNDNKPGGSAHF